MSNPNPRKFTKEDLAKGQANSALVRSIKGKSTIAREQQTKCSLESVVTKLAIQLDKGQGKLEPSQVKTTVEAADKLFGWSSQQQPRCLVQVGEMNLLQARAEPSTPLQVVVEAEAVKD